MLRNAYFLAKIGADTAENKRHFAENCLTAAAGFLPFEPRDEVCLGPLRILVEGLEALAQGLRGELPEDGNFDLKIEFCFP